MKKQTNARYLIFAGDSEAQLKFDDEKVQHRYANLNRELRQLRTDEQLKQMGVRQGVIGSNSERIKILSKELDHLSSFLCDEMNTYLLGYAQVLRKPVIRARRDNRLLKVHQLDIHPYAFKECPICHQAEKSQVHYFIAKDINHQTWFDMLDDMVCRYRRSIMDGSEYTALIYFHNLDYDVQNLLQVIVENFDRFDDIQVMNSNNTWYSLKFKYRNCCFELRDSFKLYAQPLAKLASLVGWEKKTAEASYEWFDLDSKKFDDELEYFIFDINILVHVLEMHFDRFKRQRIALTIAGYAEKELKKCIREDDHIRGTKNYYKIFNVHLKDHVEQYIRSAYFGGFVYANHNLIDQKLHHGITADVNSLYPSVMLNRNYPDIHSMRELKKDEFNQLKLDSIYLHAIVSIRISKLKLKDEGVPCFPKKMSFGTPKDIMSINDLTAPGEQDVVVNLTTLDLYHIKKNYEIKFEFETGMIFDESIKRPFKSFVLKHKKEKEDAVREGNMVKKLIAKLMLNSTYGKFAQKNIEEEVMLVLGEDGLPALVTQQQQHDEDKKRHNILLGVFITAYARDVLLKAIEVIQKSDLAEFWYCDTDSVHFGYKGEKDYINDASEILEDVGIPFDPAEFGKWKDEQYMEFAKYIGNKRYWEYDPVLKSKGKDPNVIKGAGIQKVGKKFLEEKGIDYFNYHNGNTIWVPFKVSKKVHGGVKIYMDFKEIKPNAWQYVDL